MSNQLQILVCTANLGNQEPDRSSLQAWIPHDGAMVQESPYPGCQPPRGASYYDLIVLGMQEATFECTQHSVMGFKPSLRSAPSVGLKMASKKLGTLVASIDHSKTPEAAAHTDSRIHEDDMGTTALHTALAKRLPSYSRPVSFQRGQMRLQVYVRKTNTNITKVDVVQTVAHNTGRAGLANKGGIVTEIVVNDSTRLAFVTAHLEAHEGASKYQQRCKTIGDILGKTKHGLHDVSLTNHYTFVLGDLNFRTDLGVSDEAQHKLQVKQLVQAQDWKTLNEADELFKALERKECLVGFETQECLFPPTFKMERQVGYTYVEKRRQSYTDRVLYKVAAGSRLRQFLYEPLDNFQSSDHKPVRAGFTVQLHQAVSFRPKMARRRSAMQMMMPRANADASMVLAHRERLHLFVNEVRCKIKDPKDGVNINPFLMVVSTPEESVRMKQTKWYKQLNCACSAAAVEDNQCNMYTNTGWPRSAARQQTWEPAWPDEALRTEIRTYNPDGSPVKMTGAMLFLSICTEETVYGTTVFDLGSLIQDFTPHKHPKAQQQPPQESSRRMMRRGSLMNLFRRESSMMTNNATSGEIDNTEATEDPVRSVHIDMPLLKNGMETGSLQATLDFWWMTEETAKALLHDENKRLNAKETCLESSVDFAGKDVHRSLLSSRKKTVSSEHNFQIQ